MRIWIVRNVALMIALCLHTAPGAAPETGPAPPFARVARLSSAPPMDNARMIYSWMQATGFSGMQDAADETGPRYLGSGYDAGWWLGYHRNTLYVGLMVPTPEPSVFFRAEATRDGDARIAADDHLMVQFSTRSRSEAGRGKSLRVRLNPNGALLVEEVEFLPGQNRFLPADAVAKLVSDKQESPAANWFTAKLAIPVELLGIASLDGQTLLAQLAFSARPLHLSWGGGREGDWSRAGELYFDPAAPAHVSIAPNYPRLFDGRSTRANRSLNFSASGSILRGEGGSVGIELANQADGQTLFSERLSFLNQGQTLRFRLPLQKAFACAPAAVNVFGIRAVHRSGDGVETVLLEQALPFRAGDAGLEAKLAAWRAARKVTRPADFDVDFIYAPYTDRLEVRVDTTVIMNLLADADKDKGAAIAAADRFAVEVRNARDEAIAQAEGAIATQQGRSVLQLPSPLPPGTYTVACRLYRGAGEIGRKTLPLTREIFPWEKNTLGREHVVIPPFEPVQVDGATVTVWGRRHVFERTGFPQSITSQDTELLAGPITLRGRVDGREAELTATTGPRLAKVAGQRIPPEFAAYEFVKGSCPIPELAPTDGSQATVAAASALGGLEVSVGATVEYEGWCQYTVTLKPGQARQVEQLDLVIPLADSATIMKWRGGHDGNLNGHGRIPAGEGVLFDSTRVPRANGLLNALIPIVFIGQPDRGLWTFLESDEGWNVDDAGPLTSLVRENGRLFLKYHIVSRPLDLAQPRTFTLAFMASPVRPRPANYRAIFWKQLFSHDTPGFRFYGSGVNGFTLYTDEDYEGLRQFIYESEGKYARKAAEARRGAPMTLYGAVSSASAGMKEFATFGSSWIFTRDLRREYLPQVEFRGRKSNGGTYTWETDAQITPITTPMDQAYIDCNLWHMVQIGRRCGINGTFYDNYRPFPPERFCNVTELTGTSWRRPDGSVQPKSTVFRRHEWQKRLATAFWLMGRPPHQIGGNEPDLSFGSNWFVEGVNDVEGRSDFIRDGKELDTYAAWVMSTSGLGQAGPSIQPVIDEHGQPHDNVRGIRVATAYALLLDQPMRRKGHSYETDGRVRDLCEALDREVGFFGAARHLPYWRDTGWRGPVPGPLVIGGYRRADGRKAVLVVLNAGEADLEASLALDGTRLLGGPLTAAWDLEDATRTSLLADHQVRVRLAPHAVQYVVAQSAGEEQP